MKSQSPAAPCRLSPFVCAVLLAAGAAAQAAPGAGPTTLAALQAEVADSYIVTFKDDDVDVRGRGVETMSGLLAAKHGMRLGRTYSHALRGFSVHAAPEAIERLRAEPSIARVEKDVLSSTATTQFNSPNWGLDRIDQVPPLLNTSYVYNQTGAGVNVYVIDTGLYADPDFGGRATGDFTAINDGYGTGDCVGHGTHVAGIIGSATYGVAKGVRLHAVRVLDCSGYGTTSTILSGVDWVTAHAVKPAIANMSIGGPIQGIENQAIANSIAAGITYVVAAGNNGELACNYSPSSVSTALVVGAMGTGDVASSYSNFGSCVGVYAPGDQIVSTVPPGKGNTMSGTSMASPHAAGVAALFASIYPTATPASIVSMVKSIALAGRLSGPNVDFNTLLLNTLGLDPSNWTAPTVAIMPTPVNVSRLGNGSLVARATASVTYGKPPYTYAWTLSGDATLLGAMQITVNNVQTAAIADAVSCSSDSGTLNVTITDALGQTARSSTPIKMTAKPVQGQVCAN